MRRFLAWIWKDSRRRVTIVLALVWLVGLTRFSDPVHVWFPLIVVSIAAAIDLAVQRILRRQWKFPSSAGVTGWLVALILDPTTGIAPMVVAVLLGLGSKYLLRIRRHWFNPAAFGIVGSAALFHVPVSWWAVSWSWIPAALVVIWMFFVLQRLKRLWLPATFLLVYLTWLAAITAMGLSVGGARSGFAGGVAQLLLDGTTMLFALVMLPEPMTSSAHRSWKYLFGTLVGVFVIVVSWLLRFVPVQTDVLLVSLLLADVVAVVAHRRAST